MEKIAYVVQDTAMRKMSSKEQPNHLRMSYRQEFWHLSTDLLPWTFSSIIGRSPRGKCAK
ncbi:unnamed protein product [Callosobruchus maculatus]|uniref:Uncharacterized protein n=1 Tax=Callosobruchus maculatus TaxID=64391 RepID=A0A653CSV1_CALMS|nr:unnamed protein product [Callosobruchus maculatus]VEN50357.1 unnamed protein product [Callosobruchus maculatus]